MENLIIDLSPKTEEFNPNAGNGRKVLRNVYFRVEVENYTDTFGYTKDQERVKKGHENTKKYFTEIVEMLQADGWELLDEEYKKEHSGHCPQLKKGIQTLYCHPQSISGDIYAEEVTTLEAAFLTAKTFKHYHTDNYRNIIVCTSGEDEQKLYHEKHDEQINDIIKNYTTTKRCNLYKDRTQIEHYIADKIKIPVLIEGEFFHNKGVPHWQYIFDHVTRLIAEGWIKTATGRDNNTIIRWVNKAEEKALRKAIAAA